MENQILHGDCIEKLKTLPDNSVDAIVTDPPYGLSKQPDIYEVVKHWINGDDYKHKGGGFMGKTWDSFVPGPSVWKECLRVLKPGGHLLCFAGTRTQDLMGLSLRMAGFEIRDMIAWVYGSGFPKSLNIGKAVDKLQGNERYVVGKKQNTYDGAMRNPNNHKSPAELSNIGKWGLNKTPHGADETKGTSAWEGWGTALKPAIEPITLARKPLDGTVAENCLKWGVGGLNIDASRVGTSEKITNHSRSAGSAISKGKYGDSSEQKTHQTDGQMLGRFPANLIHDGSEEVRECFPETESGARTGASSADDSRIFKLHGGACKASSGNASRFFKSIIYQPKASKAERNAGCDGLEAKHAGHQPMRKCMVCGGWNVTSNGKRCECDKPQYKDIARTNNHPTIKPIALCEYLIKMITATGGVVLDPFAGSGTTGIAAKRLGYNYILIEKEAEYIEIIKARLSQPKKPQNKQINMF